MTSSRSCRLGATTLLILLMPMLAGAQTGGQAGARKWEISGHVSFEGTTGDPDGSVLALSAPGEPFVTPFFTVSRRIPSWQFGDGALLFNEAAFNSRTNVAMVPLDPVMQRALSDAASVSGGVRVGRQVWRRLSVHGSVDYERRMVRPSSVEVANQTSASFVNGFEQLLRPATASSTVDTHGSQDLLAAATLRWTLTGERRIVPYVTAGLGWAFAIRRPELLVSSRYEISNGTLAESDIVTISERRTLGAIGIIGAGARVSLGSRWGVLVEGAVRVAERDVQVLITTNAERESRGGTRFTTSGAIAAVVASPQSTSASSSLSAPAITDRVTFDGRVEREVQPVLSGGLFFRF